MKAVKQANTIKRENPTIPKKKIEKASNIKIPLIKKQLREAHA